MQRLQLLESLTNDYSSMAPKEAMEALGLLATAIQQGLRQEWRPTQMPVIKALLPASARSCSFSNAGTVSWKSSKHSRFRWFCFGLWPSTGCCLIVLVFVAGGLGCSSIWLPFDVYMEAAMEGRRLSIRSNAEILSG